MGNHYHLLELNANPSARVANCAFFRPFFGVPLILNHLLGKLHHQVRAFLSGPFPKSSEPFRNIVSYSMVLQKVKGLSVWRPATKESTQPPV